jgi:catechol 2,3-dioxygenase-like lactoylglutathione lyase family enzyme
MSMSVGVLDHYNVSTRNLRDTVRFYEEVLGLVNGPRPPFDFPGAWLYSEGHPVLHLRFRRHRSYRVWQPWLRGAQAASHAQRRAVSRQRGAEQHTAADFRDRPEQRVDRAQLRRREGDAFPLNRPSAATGAAVDRRCFAFSTFSAIKRGSANAATCTSGVQYFVGNRPARS